jgi:hypothetical protein
MLLKESRIARATLARAFLRSAFPVLALAGGLSMAQPQSPTDSALASAQDGRWRVLTVVDGRLAPADERTSVLPPLRTVENGAFRVGERLRYRLRYGPIIAGNAELAVEEIVLFRGRPAYRIVSRARSNKFFSKFYKVDDHVESLTDVDGLFSWWAEKHLREGRYRADRRTEFDQLNRRIYSNEDTLQQAPPFVQDILSGMYYLRTFDLEVGQEILLDTFSDGKLYPLRIKVLGREPVKTPAGRFDCLVVEPFLQTPALFKQKGRIQVWLTNDRRKLPVLMRTQIYVSAFSLGSVVAELEEMEGVLEEK